MNNAIICVSCQRECADKNSDRGVGSDTLRLTFPSLLDTKPFLPQQTQAAWICPHSNEKCVHNNKLDPFISQVWDKATILHGNSVTKSHFVWATLNLIWKPRTWIGQATKRHGHTKRSHTEAASRNNKAQEEKRGREEWQRPGKTDCRTAPLRVSFLPLWKRQIASKQLPCFWLQHLCYFCTASSSLQQMACE